MNAVKQLRRLGILPLPLPLPLTSSLLSLELVLCNILLPLRCKMAMALNL